MTPVLIQRLASSASFRFKRWQLGLEQSTDLPDSLGAKIAGKNVKLIFPVEERQVFVHEFGKMFIEDCYNLGAMGKSVKTVLDIGANLGLFSLAARHHFPGASIHAYEPNERLEPYLKSNLQPFSIDLYMEALGSSEGRVHLDLQENSLHTISVTDPDGTVVQNTLENAVARLGGKVDLLKLDCEGAEWSLFESREVWENVRQVTMEYHLWAKPHSRLEDLTEILRLFGFATVRTFPSQSGTFGLLWATRTSD